MPVFDKPWFQTLLFLAPTIIWRVFLIATRVRHANGDWAAKHKWRRQPRRGSLAQIIDGFGSVGWRCV